MYFNAPSFYIGNCRLYLSKKFSNFSEKISNF